MAIWGTRARRLALVGLVATSVAIGGCVAARKFVRLIVFARQPNRSFASPVWPGVEVVDYDTRDGVRLRGYRIRAKTPGAPTMVFFHGNGGTAGGFIPFGREVANLGVNVFLAEYRGYAGLAGEPTEAGLYDDGEAAVTASGAPPDSVLLAGWSLGTAVAIELASRGIGKEAVLLAPFTSMLDVARTTVVDPQFRGALDDVLGPFSFLAVPGVAIVRGPLAPLLLPDRFDSASKIDRVNVPVVVVHGDADRLVPWEQGKAIAERAPHGRFITIAGAPHTVVGHPEVRRVVADLLSSQLPPGSSSDP